MRSTARWRQSSPRIGSRGPEFRLGKTHRACSSPDRAFGSGPKGSRFDSCQAHQISNSGSPPDALRFRLFAHRMLTKCLVAITFLVAFAGIVFVPVHWSGGCNHIAVMNELP